MLALSFDRVIRALTLAGQTLFRFLRDATPREVSDAIASLLPSRMVREIWKETGKDKDGDPIRVLYLRRYFLTPHWFPLRVWVHFIAKDDDDRDLHTHPWSFLSVVLRRGYLECMPDGSTHRREAGSWALRSAEDAHRVKLLPSIGRFRAPDGSAHWDAVWGTWTLMIAARPRRTWGFVTKAGHVDWREYLGLPANTPDSPEDRIP